jgi:hypothetical protein
MTHEIILEAGRAERHYWLELWQYREVFRVLAWRDLTARYKQTVIGVPWAAIPAAGDNRGVYRRFRQIGQSTFGRHGLIRDHGLCGDAAVNRLFHYTFWRFQ